MKVDISVVIPTRNRKNTLLDTINSFCNGEFIPNQIVIIDQSDDKYRNQIKEEIEKFKKTNITYYYLEKPSLTKARNIGKKLAIHDIMICSDDDILVYNDTIKNIYEIFMSEQEISLIAAVDTRSENIKNNKVQSIMGYIFSRKNLFKSTGHVTKAIFGTYPKNIKKRIDTEWAMGYFFAIRKNILDASDIYWDENLVSYAYPEDLDFSHRFYRYSKAKGMKMIIDPTVKVEHCTSQEWRITSMQNTLMYIMNREYLSYKLYPNNNLSRILTKWANIGEFFRRLIIKDNALDILRALYICFKNKDSIKKGIFPY